MRVYLPVGWAAARELDATGELRGEWTAYAVDARWRSDAPDVDAEEWEYEAQELAAVTLADAGGVVLAVDLDHQPDPVDGTLTVSGPVPRARLAAVLDADLAWYGVQELPSLLQQHPHP